MIYLQNLKNNHKVQMKLMLLGIILEKQRLYTAFFYYNLLKRK